MSFCKMLKTKKIHSPRCVLFYNLNMWKGYQKRNDAHCITGGMICSIPYLWDESICLALPKRIKERLKIWRTNSRLEHKSGQNAEKRGCMTFHFRIHFCRTNVHTIFNSPFVSLSSIENNFKFEQ